MKTLLIAAYHHPWPTRQQESQVHVPASKLSLRLQLSQMKGSHRTVCGSAFFWQGGGTRKKCLGQSRKHHPGESADRLADAQVSHFSLHTEVYGYTLASVVLMTI